MAGKTGTAQVISNQGKERARGSKVDLRDHGWFVFMTPKDNPELAGVIFVEHGEHGYCGATIAKHIIQTYYAQRDGLPLPAMPPSRRRVSPARRRPPRRPWSWRRRRAAEGALTCSNGASTSTSTGC